MTVKVQEKVDQRSFQKIGSSKRLFQEVAHQIEDRIIRGDLKPGDRLPPERILGEQFGVSRTVIREAIKALELKGLAKVQHGLGVIVVKLSADSVADSVVRFVKIEESPIWALQELRSILEVEIAGLAAERRSDEDVRTISALIDQMAGKVNAPSEYIALDTEFHRALAKAAHNPLFSLVLEPFVTLLLETRRLGSSVPDAPKRSITAHRRIAQAVRNHNRKEARRAMSDHFANLAAFISEAEQRRATGR